MPEAEKAASAEGEAPKIEPEKAESEEAAVRPKAAPPEAVEPKESFVTPMEDPARGEELWNEARKMPHQFVPDKETDAKYLSLLVSSAELGFAEAQAKLGEYAVRRGCLVEAYYWMWRSNEKGWAASSYRAMRELRLVWLGAGAATEFDNVHEAFDKRRGAFARALLQFHCGLDRVNARKCIVELANKLPEARRFLRIKTDP